MGPFNVFTSLLAIHCQFYFGNFKVPFFFLPKMAFLTKSTFGNFKITFFLAKMAILDTSFYKFLLAFGCHFYQL